MRTKVSVQDFIEKGGERLKLELVAGREGVDRPILEAALNRPQLALAGFYDYFAHRRIQVVGLAEHAYLSSLDQDQRALRMEKLFKASVPCVVFSRYKRVFPETAPLGDRFNVPVLRTRMVTRHFMNAATLVMEDMMAPRISVQGTMLEVAGLGVLIEGSPGIGKSETALGLIKRGHALVSDDVTSLRRESSGRVVGSAVGLTRHHMEIHGVGIVYIPSIFGVAAVRGEKQLDFLVTLRRLDVDMEFDRSGEEQSCFEILGVKIPQVIIPVAPGRDLVNIVETAALEYKLRLSGQVAVHDLDERLKQALENKR